MNDPTTLSLDNNLCDRTCFDLTRSGCCNCAGWSGDGIGRRAEFQLGRFHQRYGFQPDLWLQSCMVQKVSVPISVCMSSLTEDAVNQLAGSR